MAKVSILIRLLVEVDEEARSRIRRHGDLSAMISDAADELTEEVARPTARRIYRRPPRQFATATTVSLTQATLDRLEVLREETGYYRSELINIALAAHCEGLKRREAAERRAKASPKESG